MPIGAVGSTLTMAMTPGTAGPATYQAPHARLTAWGNHLALNLQSTPNHTLAACPVMGHSQFNVFAQFVHHTPSASDHAKHFPTPSFTPSRRVFALTVNIQIFRLRLINAPKLATPEPSVPAKWFDPSRSAPRCRVHAFQRRKPGCIGSSWPMIFSPA